MNQPSIEHRGTEFQRVTRVTFPVAALSEAPGPSREAP
jgi:hypothetical protein